jgi:hypothetical protein
LKRHKHDPSQARAMVKGGPSPEVALKGMALEHEVELVMKRFGLQAKAPEGSKP